MPDPADPPNTLAEDADDHASPVPDDESGFEPVEPEVDGVRPALAEPVDDACLAAWMARITERDERALGALYDATLSRVYGLVLRIVRRPAWADEVVEETYFQVWRQAPRFDPERGRPMTWLLGMARSRAIDALRREARFRHESLDADDAVEIADSGLPAVDELLDAAQGHAALHRALMTLNPQPRQLVALAFFRGLSHEEIADQTELPLGTVKSQIRRALLSLRKTLDPGSTHPLAA
jgi:RNA polymerase sigma-70 factor (ECF subfamily)